jgi:hypothetical protein
MRSAGRIRLAPQRQIQESNANSGAVKTVFKPQE